MNKDTFQGPKYEPQQEIAKGGMGAVWRASDRRLKRQVAMKVMLGRHNRESDQLRFLREAEVLANLEHPNIVPIHDLALDADDQPYYTMKLVDGVTLKEVINRLKTGDAEAVEQYPLTQLLTIFQKVCDAVAFAHSKGIVHRDLKPENIMLGGFGEVLVMDWGLAKVLGDGRDALQRVQEPDGPGAPRPYQDDEGFHELDQMPGGDSALTMEGQVMGTPQFMAPEQAAGEIAKIDERSDVFSLGGILYSLLTLRPPTGGSTVREVLENMKSGYIAPAVIYNKHRKRAADGSELSAPIELAHCPGQRIPDALSAVCQKAMGMEQEQRYQTVQELQEDISAYQGGFATGAEGAGRMRRFNLWVRRNKALSISVVVVVMFMAAVMGRIISSERAARQALIDLRGLLPTLEKEVEGLVRAHQFEDALNRVNYMLALAPGNADYLNQKGNLLQSLLRFEESAEAYQEALEGKRDLPHAQENLKLSEKLAAELTKGKKPEPRHYLELETAMNRQNRLVESVAMLVSLRAKSPGNLRVKITHL